MAKKEKRGPVKEARRYVDNVRESDLGFEFANQIIDRCEAMMPAA